MERQKKQTKVSLPQQVQVCEVIPELLTSEQFRQDYGKLNARQRLFLAVFARVLDVPTACEQTQITQKTFWQWLRVDERFARCYAAIVRKRVLPLLDDAEITVKTALERLRQLVQSPNPKIALKAISIVLEKVPPATNLLLLSREARGITKSLRMLTEQVKMNTELLE